MSKGSTGRPFSVSNQEYANRWEAIFGKDNEKKDEAQNLESTKSHQSCPSGSSDNPEGQAGQTQDA